MQKRYWCFVVQYYCVQGWQVRVRWLWDQASSGFVVITCHQAAYGSRSWHFHVPTLQPFGRL